MPSARLTPSDIKGAWAIMPTPAKENAADWRSEDTVDLDETARVVDALIRAGIDGILSLGTLGECATLTRAEKRAFMGAVAEAARGRVPCFGGTTTLNTRDTVAETRLLLDAGLDGTMLGLPMWCQPDVPTAVQFYKDVAEACPTAAICVYANFEAFKFLFPRPFWAQVAEIPQVVCSKYLGVGTLEADLRMVAGKIRLLPSDSNYYAAARISPEEMTGFWSGGALCGPSVSTRLRDDVAAAKTSHDWTTAKKTAEAIAAASASLFPLGSFAEFSKYNIPLEKARMNAGGFAKAGPCRPPYHIAPADYIAGAQRSGRMLAELHVKLSAETPNDPAAGAGR
jgi:trans-o-hydroxybenzylidenepyruvate hydratase-aldolase